MLAVIMPTCITCAQAGPSARPYEPGAEPLTPSGLRSWVASVKRVQIDLVLAKGFAQVG